MHLKSLVLKGFKSFADRSVLGFEPGITAVVGPNGSGKSNISDSVLWVLGERNAKNLRGQAMEDVIFAGSSARKSVGVAEVDLILDNSDGTLPIDFNEVALTRRMYRSGESEYLINGAIARRMDVLDILHDTGLGTGTHSIISQGSLDSILQSKPEDRRALIEEAAGVLKHKQRKLKSERKLEQMDAHLTRVRDVAAEVERQLKPLERKAKRAQSYQGLAAELAELNLALAVDDLRILQGKWGDATEQETKLVTELENMREHIKHTEEQMQVLQEQMQERSINAGEVARQYRRAQSALERFDSAIMLFHEKKRSSQAYEADIQLTLETNRQKLIQAQSALEQAASQLEKTREERLGAQAVVDRLQNDQALQLAQRAGLEKDLEAFSKAERELTQEMEAVRAAQAENLELLSTSKAHEKLLTTRAQELEAQWELATKELEQSARALETQEAELEKLRTREAEAREEVATCFATRERIRESQEALRENVSLTAAEIKGLEERVRASESANPALTWLMDNKKDFGIEIEALSHLISAPRELEPLIEWVLGADLHAMCIQEEGKAIKIAQALCERKDIGELVLVPQREMTPPRKDRSSVGISLIDLLEYPASYEMVVDALVGDIYLCESIEQAREAHAASAGQFRYMTRDGFMIWSNGKISLGLGREDEEGELARHRHLEELRKKAARLQVALDQAIADKEVADSALKAAQSTSLLLSQELAEMQGVFKAATEDHANKKNKRESLSNEVKDLREQREVAQKALSDAQPTSEEHEVRLKKLTEELESFKAQIISAQKDILPLRDQIKDRNEELSEARLKVGTLSERESYAQRMLTTNEQEIRSLTIENQVSKETLAKKVIAKQRIEPLLELFEELAASVRKWTQQLELATTQEQDSSSGLHTAITEARSKAREAHDVFDEMNDRLSQAKVEKGRLELQVEAAINTIVHDCRTPLEQAIEAPKLENRSETEDAAFKLRRRIANMGTINPDAAVEYEDLKNRFDYMSAQLDDMLAARRALAKIIRVIDARMKEDFIQTFELVNEYFKEIFAVLFPGGSAELLLVDPDDLENTGVEVTAQPRGKRITKMMLMSGGEKSLTALALLFAVYRIRSTPFYILDEVEAALDDTNLRRLCAYFDSLRETTQLILITHQRRTMELADVLYGISMQADGVTRVVSQKLDRALQYAEG